MKKTIIALIALAGVAAAADVTQDQTTNPDFSIVDAKIDLDDVAKSTFEGGTFAISFMLDTLIGVDLNLQVANGLPKPNGESYYVALTSNSTYLSLTIPGMNFSPENYLMPTPDLRGAFVIQCVTGADGTVATLSHLNGTSLDEVFSVSSSTPFPTTINTASLSLGNMHTSSVSDLRTWNGEVTAENMQDPPPAPPSVPEPTTATLSLLALAGLAARRRRK